MIQDLTMHGATAQPAPAPYELADVPAGIARRWIAPLVSGAILVAALLQLRHLDLRGLVAIVPAAPAFWLAFAAYYMAQPAADWAIFRRLWRLPVRGLAALMRKQVSNEILLGYSGELYFYGWARRHVALVAAPFGAVKDVAILSAAVANTVTLALVAASWPLLRGLRLDATGRALALSALVVTIVSFAPLVLRRWLFALPRAELRFVALVHLARVVGQTALTALLWALVLPSVPVSWWLVLATLRLVVSRLPLLPNKDLVFAGLAAFLVGQRAAVTEMVSMIAALTLATHLVVGVVLAAAETARAGERA